MKQGRRHCCPFCRRGLHDTGVVVTGGAMQVRYAFHRSGPEMFLVTNRAGTIFDHVRLVQIVFFRRAERRMLLMAILALAIDRAEIEALVEPVADRLSKLRQSEILLQRHSLVVTPGAIPCDRGVTARNRSRVKEFFVAAFLERDDGGDPPHDRDEAGAPARHPPWVLPFVIAEG